MEWEESEQDRQRSWRTIPLERYLRPTNERVHEHDDENGDLDCDFGLLAEWTQGSVRTDGRLHGVCCARPNDVSLPGQHAGRGGSNERRFRGR